MLALLIAIGPSVGRSSTQGSSANVLEVMTLQVNEKLLPTAGQSMVRLSPSADDLTFTFGFCTNAGRFPVRLCCKLEGYDEEWRRGGGEMFLVIRFYGENGDILGRNDFEVHADSAGWLHDLQTSPLTHRRESVIVPSGAVRLAVVITSAGPQSTEGVYVVSDLNVSSVSSNNESSLLVQFPGEQSQLNRISNSTPRGWSRDGTTPSMAKVVELGNYPKTMALEILDSDPLGHAEWNISQQTAPRVRPGDRILIEWNEMYSIGESGMRKVHYTRLPPGDYRFRAMEVDLMGVPTGIETSMAIVVPQPFWKTPWFSGLLLAGAFGAILAAWRWTVQRKIRREMLRLEKQHLLEQERLRIARNIHDDLGARVTQISLASAMTNDDVNDVKSMRAALDQISHISHNLLTALYETVWTVNPENDHLNALGNYLFQVVNELCDQGQCRHRFQVDELPRDAVVSSNVRHNLCMVVKEAVNNVIKHAGATEILLRVNFKRPRLVISIEDNGRGFDPLTPSDGHGLTNMKKRLEDIGGECRVESQPGKGTTVVIQLEVG